MTTRFEWRTLTMFAFSAAMAIAPPAFGQTKKEWAEKVVVLQQAAIDNIARGLASQAAQQMMQPAGQAMASVPPEKREEVGKDVQAEIKKFYDEIEPLLRDRAAKLAPATLSPILESKFSEDELKQLAAWLESPAAKKFQQLGAEMQSTLANKLIEDSRTNIEPKLRALEQRLQKKFSSFAPSAPASSASGASKASAPVVKKK